MRNRLKAILKKKEVSFGGYISIGHPDVAEIIGGIGFDWVLFDTEHAPLEVATVQNLLQAMRFSKSVPLMRVPWNDMVMIKRALDIGTQGIVVPWVNSKEDAARAVRSIRYPPEGLRGYGPRRASIVYPDYVPTANREIFLGIQIETQDAVENIDEILSVEGIDATFIGPNDLSLSLGVFGKWDHPKYTSALKTILEASIRNNVTPGVLSPLEWQKRLKEGFRMIMIAPDVSLLQEGAGNALRGAKEFASSLKSRVHRNR